jgi:hypothetical protein
MYMKSTYMGPICITTKKKIALGHLQLATWMWVILMANKSPRVNGDVGMTWQIWVLRNVHFATLPLGQVAYWPRRDTWINHVANVSATWRESTWPSRNVDSHPRGHSRPHGFEPPRHSRPCGPRARGHFHVVNISHMAKFAHFFFF